MPEQELPQTAQFYLIERIAALDPHARLVCVLDPQRQLDLGASLQTNNKLWQVICYTGNDLKFRSDYSVIDGQPLLIWLTQQDSWHPEQPETLKLSSLADVLTQADAILDLSLRGVLGMLIPGETWPHAALNTQTPILSRHLPEVVNGYKSIRRYLPPAAALDASVVRAIVLHCIHPSIPAHEFLFQQDSAGGVLTQYVNLVWGSIWDETATGILREQARLAPRCEVTSIIPWLDAPADGLARYLCLYRLFSQARLPNVANQLRGLGLLGFDPQALEPRLGNVLARWDRDVIWHERIIQQAESILTLADYRRIIEILNPQTVSDVLKYANQAEVPGMVCELAARLLHITDESGALDKATVEWGMQRSPSLDTLPDTQHTKTAKAYITILDDLAFLNRLLSTPMPQVTSLPDALNWYVQSRTFELELAQARASTQLRNITDDGDRRLLQEYLDQTHTRICQYLDHADNVLATLITGNFSDYLNSPRLSINVLRDLVLKRRTKPTQEACLWVIVFDGMRWDTWDAVVKPKILETFEIKDEKAYLSLLPSWTKIARTGLLAGQTPLGWKSYRGAYTENQATLVARLFGVTEREQTDKLRFMSRTESDRTYRKLDAAERFPFNVLVFNISDDNIHSLTGSLVQVNQVVDQLLTDIMETLHSLIKSQDTVIVSSDHGFTELDDDTSISIPDDERWQRYMEGGQHPVTYRYIANADPPVGLKSGFSFEYRGVSNSKYTVAIGRQWFVREETRGNTDRYAHGGISFAEMVVPGALLQRITLKRLEVKLGQLPTSLTVDEDRELALPVPLINSGNQPVTFELAYRADTDPQWRTMRSTIQPGEQTEAMVNVQPVYRLKGGSTSAINLRLSFGPIGGSIKKAPPHDIPVEVKPRKGKIEISMGGLDDLDL